MGVLPLKDREKVLMEQKKFLSHKRLTLLKGWSKVGHAIMMDWVHATGIWSRTVKVVPLGFEVELHYEEIFFKLMALNGQYLQGSPTPLKVSSLPFPGHLTTKEVANLMEGWLKDK